MALGSPAIPNPAAVDLRSVANVVANIRQRIEAIEAALKTSLPGAGTDTKLQTLSQQGAGYASQIATLQLQVAALQAALASISPAAAAAVTQQIILMQGEDGEDGLTIPGPQGLQGSPGLTVYIPGEDGADADITFHP